MSVPTCFDSCMLSYETFSSLTSMKQDALQSFALAPNIGDVGNIPTLDANDMDSFGQGHDFQEQLPWNDESADDIADSIFGINSSETDREAQAKVYQSEFLK